MDPTVLPNFLAKNKGLILIVKAQSVVNDADIKSGVMLVDMNMHIYDIYDRNLNS